MKAQWRSASMDCGGQYVTLVGITMMPVLCADNWGTVLAQVWLSWEQDITGIIIYDLDGYLYATGRILSVQSFKAKQQLNNRIVIDSTIL